MNSPDIPDHWPKIDKPTEEIALRAIKEIVSEEKLRILAAVFPFSLVCEWCDTDGPATYDEAIKEGWKDIQFNDGPSFWFLGDCPACPQDNPNYFLKE